MLRFNYHQIWQPANLILIILVPSAFPACLRTKSCPRNQEPESPHHTEAQHGTVPFPGHKSSETVDSPIVAKLMTWQNHSLSKPIWDPPSFPERPFQSYSDHLSYTRKVFTLITIKKGKPHCFQCNHRVNPQWISGTKNNTYVGLTVHWAFSQLRDDRLVTQSIAIAVPPVYPEVHTLTSAGVNILHYSQIIHLGKVSYFSKLREEFPYFWVHAPKIVA